LSSLKTALDRTKNNFEEEKSIIKNLAHLEERMKEESYLVQGSKRGEAIEMRRSNLISRLDLRDARNLEHSLALAINFEDCIATINLSSEASLGQLQAAIHYIDNMNIHVFKNLVDTGDRILATYLDVEES